MGFGNGFDNGASVSRAMNYKYPTKPKKTVFPGDMAIHVWAQRTQTWGRNSKASVYFDGDTLYSYGSHYVAAKFVTDRKGRTVVLFNQDSSYGPTTNGQVWAAHRAVKDETPRFTVKRPNATCDSDHIDNLRDMLSVYNARKADSENKRMRPATRLLALEAMDSLVEEMTAYRAAFLKASQFKIPAKSKGRDAAEQVARFGEAVREFNEAKSLWDRKINCNRGYGRGRKASIRDLTNHLGRMLRAYATARRVALATDKLPAFDVARTITLYRAYRASCKRAGWHGGNSYYGHNFASWAAYRERDAIKKVDERNEYPAKTVESARLWFDGSSSYMSQASIRDLEKLPAFCDEHGLPLPSNWQAALDAAKAGYEKALAKEADAQRNAAEKAKQAISEWLDCKPNARPSYNWPVMMRQVGNRVQTTKGAEFPVDDAKRAWPVIKACYDAGRAWKRNGATLPMGHFQVDAITSSGTIIAGCHTIERREIERFAGVLGLQ